MCAAEGYSTAPKSKFICLFCYGRHPKTPHRSTLHTMLEKDFFVCFGSDTQKRSNIFLLGISWSKLPAFIQHCTCTVKSPAFRTCQNYCVCTAVLLSAFQNACESEHAQGFWKCKPGSDLLGTYSSVQFRNFIYSLVYLHFAYLEKVK